MVERWLKSWLDDGRTGLTDWLRLTTNNHIERWHQEYKKTATLDRILKRYPELIEWISGRGIFGRSAAPSVMDMAALTARDHSHSDWVPRIPKDVRLRHHLGNCILLVDGLKELVPGKIFAVRAGVAPASVLKLDIETERELVEMELQALRALRYRLCGATLHDAHLERRRREAEQPIPPPRLLLSHPPLQWPGGGRTLGAPA